MLRIIELKLPLDHSDDDLNTAILQRLAIPAEACTRYSIFRRSVDARTRQHIFFIYTLDVETPLEAAILARNPQDPQLVLTPDTTYRQVTRAATQALRPVVIGLFPAAYLQA